MRLRTNAASSPPDNKLGTDTQADPQVGQIWQCETAKYAHNKPPWCLSELKPKEASGEDSGVWQHKPPVLVDVANHLDSALVGGVHNWQMIVRHAQARDGHPMRPCTNPEQDAKHCERCRLPVDPFKRCKFSFGSISVHSWPFVVTLGPFRSRRLRPHPSALLAEESNGILDDGGRDIQHRAEAD